MTNGPGMPLRRDEDAIRSELEKLRRERPAEYARESARLLRELEQLSSARKRYALT